MKNIVLQKLEKIVKELTDKDIKIELNTPQDIGHGDYTSNVAMRLSSLLGRNPMDIAKEITEKLTPIEGVERIEIATPGFINFTLSSSYLINEAKKLLNDDFGVENVGKGRPAVVEYSSPNIAKPFTIGHLRSTIIGDAIANLVEEIGYTVYRDNHLGDWGTQFGKQIYAIKTWGNEAEIEQSADPIKDLVALYVKFHEEAEKNPELEEEGRKWFKRLEDKDPEAVRLWLKCIGWSFKEFDRIYGELGVHFTENGGRGYGEAAFEDKMQPVIEELRQKKLMKLSEGAEVVFYPDDVLPPLMILKKDGATLYATRDLATDKFRLSKYGEDVLVINEVGAEQSLYWRQIFMLEEMLGWYKKGQRVHVGHGLYRFKEGKMSTRKGNVIWLEDVLREAIERAKQLGSSEEEIAKEVGIGALKWNDLKRSSHLDVTFDWEEVLNMQGNSGPYVQYSYVRTKSLLKDEKGKFDENYQPNSDEKTLLRQLMVFGSIVTQAAVSYSPHILALYLFDLAQNFNLFYQKNRILNASTPEEKAFRLALTQATGSVLKKGLSLLGIAAPAKM